MGSTEKSTPESRRDEPMTAPTDQFVEIANRTQEAVTTAVRTWADTVQSVAGGFAGGRPALPDAHVAVDRYFDFAHQVLDNQRRFAQSVLTAGTQAAEAVTEQASRAAESVTTHTVNATEAAANKAGQAAKAASEQAATTARAARNSTKS
jgi:hypothetical protein